MLTIIKVFIILFLPWKFSKQISKLLSIEFPDVLFLADFLERFHNEAKGEHIMRS